MTVTILKGDCRDVLRTLPAESVHCVVTSPPYWGLRDYGIDGQLGLEPTPDAYVANMVEIFREVRRVLRKDGTLWLNLGDSYAQGEIRHRNGQSGTTMHCTAIDPWNSGTRQTGHKVNHSLKPKDLCGIPWRVAFALQADGWWLRQDIIWSKPNPMPESVTDRCTKSHEYIFLLSKNERYYYDAEAIAETSSAATKRGMTPNEFAKRYGSSTQPYVNEAARKALRSDIESRHRSSVPDGQSLQAEPNGIRNKRSVWEVATQPFSEAHFATFPPALIEPCILAGCPKDGIVLDPFGGAGTTGLIADRLQRNAMLIELNPEYTAMAERRIKDDAPLFAQLELQLLLQPDEYDGVDDFGRSIDEAYRAIRERKAKGGPGWEPP
jgi:DNA modification methylase